MPTPSVEGMQEQIPPFIERAMLQLYRYVAGDWKNMPTDKVQTFIRNELLDVYDAGKNEAQPKPSGEAFEDWKETGAMGVWKRLPTNDVLDTVDHIAQLAFNAGYRAALSTRAGEGKVSDAELS